MERSSSPEITPPEEEIITNQTDFSAKSWRLERKFQEQQLNREVLIGDLVSQWDRVLSFFGTDAARESFLQLCQEYKEALSRAKRVKAGKQSEEELTSSDSERAAIHNQIMLTLRNLHMAKNWSGADRDLLMELQDRNAVEAVIDRVFQVGGTDPEAA